MKKTLMCLNPCRLQSRFLPSLRAAGGALLAASLLALFPGAAFSAETTNSLPAAPAGKKLARTVGLDIAKRTVNPDKTISLVFHWSEKGKPAERTVVANESTIVVLNSQVKKIADLTDEEWHGKAVATVGADDTTVVLLRFGKSPLPKEQLTPAQLALIASLTPPTTATSEEALDKKVSALVDSLDLKDAAKRDRVRAVLAADLRAVRDAHNAGLQLDPSVHKAFVSGLEANLTPEQVELVKDKLTSNKAPMTFRVYHEILPKLTAEDDHKILDRLKRAREESLDVKSVEEMTPIFKKYKKEIESYIDNQGYDWKKSYKTFVDHQRAGSTNSAAKP